MMTFFDGTEARVRPISPDDGASPPGIPPGFVGPTPVLAVLLSAPRPQLERDPTFDLVDGVDRVALVVEVNGELIAVGRYERLSDQTQAEVAFVVADAYQHHHSATELLHALLSTCQWGKVEIAMDIASAHQSGLGAQTGTRQVALAPPSSTV
jgi:hypothetical protein